MNLNLLLISATTALIVSVNLAFDDSENVLKSPPIPGSRNVLPKSEIIQLKGAVGPESIAFDPKGEGPYTGVADGRILKWQGTSWADFAVTSSHRKNCTLPSAPEMEHVCGRPLGLRFDTRTGDLYIADAYLGLQVVGPKGGLATPLVQKVEGKPLVFTNDVDFDDHDDVIYFTETSTKYQRRQFSSSELSGDRTGRLIKYVKSTKKATVLLRGLALANGVSLSKDLSFVLVAETANFRILRYWLKGPLAGTHDIFAELPGFPDNIRINSRGEFWVALHAKRSVFAKLSISDLQLGKALLKLPITAQQLDNLLAGGQPHATAMKLSEDGRVLEVLEDVEGKTLRTLSEVEEKHGKLWFGSVATSVLRVYELLKFETFTIPPQYDVITTLSSSNNKTKSNSEFSQTSHGTLNSSNPLYLHPAENVGSTLLPVVFYGTSYRSWRRRILRALSVKNKLDFINGKSRRPAEDSLTFDQWERCDNIVTSWLLNSFSRDLVDNLQYVNDARELWQDLEDMYDQINGAKLYQLQKEINDMS
ncbi:Protein STRICTOSIDINE SYNTHASE-LIKE 10 [Capsicum baccatum]|uniref:Protein STRICTOSIDINE SYNTHASE-LIKE 10 n=1 Tax=Capsicum baccatum TaxID=33114 RepID=A0A2G2WEG7_CAPBA|nr:Protein STRICTOSIDINE SYNTHASE-LIKE 10 [Capsicum baccatum]